ncbi:MAG: YHS domain-containing protein [Candidatus Methanoperedens sp.]|nr:YHS domain-containing protein [Candidatus Methanoperedens sp.]
MAICKCPICGCGVEINETNSQLKSEYMGLAYFFYTPACKRIFDASPVSHAAVC